ncbi:T9SS type A sorting domain-containing protein [Flavobacterium sp. SM2513]|uniref:T9SS type A sorting domain-containing protein n=1 Tax=Flavobacterium sp. SM2513 TaxID=3424766 RepID=UPI003D7F6A44
MKKTTLLLFLTLFSSVAFCQMTDYVSGLSFPTQMTADGSTIYVNGFEKIYSIDTTNPSATGTEIYTSPSDFYIYKTQVLGNFLFILVENYIASTDTTLGSRILKLNLTNLGAGAQIIVTTTQFISSFTLSGSTIYYCAETATGPNPDVFLNDLYSFDATQTIPTPVLAYSDLDTEEITDMAVYNNILYMSSYLQKVFSLNLSSSSSPLVEFITNLSVKGIFISTIGEVYLANGSIVKKIPVTNTSNGTQEIGQNTVYEDENNGMTYFANFRDVLLIGNKVYGTLANQGKVVRFTDTTLGTNEFTDATKLMVYPNPASNYFIISETDKHGTVELINTTGQIVFQKEFSSNQQIEVNVPSGIYFAKIKIGDTEEVRKLIIR